MGACPLLIAMGTGLSVTTASASEVLVAQIVPLRASAPAFEKAVAVTPIPGAEDCKYYNLSLIHYTKTNITPCVDIFEETGPHIATVCG